jgi:hypothetical protein
LGLAVDFGDGDGDEGMADSGFYGTGLFPEDLSGSGIHCGDEWIDASVTDDDESTVVEDGGATAAMEGRIFEFGIEPLDGAAGCLQSSHSEGTEVHIDSIFVDDGGGAGVAVFGVYGGCFRDGDNFLIPEDFSGGGIECNSTEGESFAAGDGGGEKDLAGDDGGGRPAESRDGGFPKDVSGFGPFEGDGLIGDMAIGGGASELWPIVGLWCEGDEESQQR